MVRINTKIGADEVDEKHNKNSRKRKIAKIDAHQGNEQQRKIINNLRIPGETWELVLGWLSRDNLIHSTCFVPGMVGAFSMRILHVKGRRKLVSLDFDWKRRPNPNPQHACRIPHPNRDKTQPQLHVNNEQPVALPECTVPDNFVDFQFIRFRYFDQQVLLFMRCIRPLLCNVNIILNEPITRLFKSDSMAALAHTLPLCSSLNALTTKLGNLYELNMHHPRLVREPRMMVLTFEEHVPVKKIAVLAEWLTTPHQQENNSPKLVVTLGNKSCTELHETIKQHFVDAERSAQFLAHFRGNGVYYHEPMEFVVDHAGQRLCLYKRTKVSGTCRLLTRHKLVQNDQSGPILRKLLKICVQIIDKYPKVNTSSGRELTQWFMRCCPIADWESAAPKWLALEQKLEKLVGPYLFVPRNNVHHQQQLEFCVEKMGLIDAATSGDGQEDGDDNEDEEEEVDAQVPGTSAPKKKRF